MVIHARVVTALFGGLAASVYLTACTDLPAPEWFPENERFGYIVTDDDTTTTRGKEYLIVEAVGAKPSTPATLARVRSTTPPQMCDTNAVSYIAPDRDRDQLIVLTVADSCWIDTVVGFTMYRARGSGPFTFPDTCIYSPQTYCLAWRDSVLAYGGNWGHARSIFEIVRLRPSGGRLSIYWGMGQFFMARDFSQILIRLSNGGPPLPDEWMSRTAWILAYDLVDDSLVNISNDFRLGGPLSRLSRESPLYCTISDRTEPGCNLCVLTDDGMKVLTTYEWPEYLSRYEVFSDSVVVWCRRYADAAHGERRSALPPL